MIAVCTTIVGIGSLMVTPIGAVRQFSEFACLGILAMSSAVLTFYPCLLAVAWPIIRNRRPNNISRQFHDIYRHLSGSFPLHLEIRANEEDFFLSIETIKILAGHHLLGHGDVADRMYVVISGVFNAVMTGSESIGERDRRVGVPKRVNRLQVGDIIGEMELMSSGYRCVSVAAVVSGDVLMLNQAHLARIRRANPRTASRFFSNLSTILTEKLI